MLLLTVVLLLPWLPSLLAQDFSIPQQWTVSLILRLCIPSPYSDHCFKNTSSVVPRNDSIQRAQGVLDSLVEYYQSDTGDVKGERASFNPENGD